MSVKERQKEVKGRETSVEFKTEHEMDFCRLAELKLGLCRYSR